MFFLKLNFIHAACTLIKEISVHFSKQYYYLSSYYESYQVLIFLSILQIFKNRTKFGIGKNRESKMVFKSHTKKVASDSNICKSCLQLLVLTKFIIASKTYTKNTFNFDTKGNK